jgi:hypothetical protein
MPEFLHQIPVPDDTSFDGVDNFLSPSELSGFLSDDEIKSLRNFPIAHSPACFGALITCVGDKSRDVEGGLGIPCIPHFGITCSIIDDCYFGIDIHQRYIYKLKERYWV